ncbi:MAG: beta-ketoacyl-ACP synthase III [Cyanobacteria bacterium P01_A01_bin.83]
MQSAYINAIGKFLPGKSISNNEIEAYLGRVQQKPSKVKNRILKSNGIQQRYYALNSSQKTTYRNSELAANAINDVLSNSNVEETELDLLACATTWSDLLVPGFGNLVLRELPEFPPLETTSHQGVCCAGIAALNYAVSQIQLGKKNNAIAVSSELASRLFINTKFEAQTEIKQGQKLNFDTEFLRWMLSDGAGACLIQTQPNLQGISLRVDWIESVSYSNAYPLCMYAGARDDSGKPSWMDYPDYSAAIADGAINLRQNIRLLEEVIKLGVRGWLKLIETGKINPEEVDWFLCHYSSHFFRHQIIDLLEQAGAMISESKWFTNLYTKGNTGCASIYLMLEELFNSGKLQPGEKICCFVPESGGFTTAYMMLTVVEGDRIEDNISISGFNRLPNKQNLAAPQSPLDSSKINNSPVSAKLLRELMIVWSDFELKLRTVAIVSKLQRGDFTKSDYLALLRNLRPQVVEGARWITRAASNMTDFELRSLFITHAQDEHRDFRMLEHNYVSVGGSLKDITQAAKNIGSEALSAFIFHQASQANPVDLIGSIFIIEGLGNQLAAKWANQIKRTLNLRKEQVSFLAYHGVNDQSHLEKLETMLNADWMSSEISNRIVKTAQVTARLYLLQLEEIQ